MNDKRLYLLMDLLSEQYQTAEYFAEKLHVSSKTVRNLLKEVNQDVKGHGALVEAKASTGYRLQVYDQKAWEDFINSYRQQSDYLSLPQSSKERIQYILEYLIHSKDCVKLDDLSETLYIAKRTLTNDLKEIENILH